MSQTFTCVRCGTSFETDQTHVRNWPIGKWWRMVAQQCANCRVEGQGEPSQVGTPVPPPSDYELEREHLIGQFHAGGHQSEQDAAVGVRHSIGQQRKKVLLLLQMYPQGLTDDEGGTCMGGDRLTFGRRRSELYKAGMVRDSGQRRKTPYGRDAIVWMLAQEAEQDA